jgi:hypothetical protein
VRDIRGVALKLAEEGNWEVVGNTPPSIVEGSRDAPSARNKRWSPAVSFLLLMRSELIPP